MYVCEGVGDDKMDEDEDEKEEGKENESVWRSECSLGG